MVGVKVISLNTGKVVFEENAEKYLMPASNNKSFTVAAALEKLTPDFKFVTTVYADSMPDASGAVKGNLRIFGRGDVSISTAFYDGDYYKGIDNLVDKIIGSGVKRVEGDLVGDESYFQGNSIPFGWEWDDLQWYYGAGISALPINDNAVDVAVTPGPEGFPCAVKVMPVNPVLRIVNQCKTAARGVANDLQITKKLDQNILEIKGSLPIGDRGFSGSIAISHPAEMFMALLRQRLQEKGVVITGQNRTVDAPATVTIAPAVEIAKLESPPLSTIAARTMKPSQNMYTETLLWTLGEKARADEKSAATAAGRAFTLGRTSSADLGIAAVKNFETSIGIPADGNIQVDGSGLSRHNLITTSALATLYAYMGKQSPYAGAWRDSLPIAGVDGTLRNRLKGTAATGNVRAKTGTIDQVSALSGYATTAGGEQLVFSIVVNGIPVGSIRTGTIDSIVLELVNFNGKIE